MHSRKPNAAITPHPKKKGKLRRRLARGALLAIGLAAGQFGVEESAAPRLFDPTLLDRLSAPLTRFHD